MGRAAVKVVSEAVAAQTLRGAYERAAQRINRVSDAQLIHITADVPAAVTTVLKALENVRRLRPQMAALLDPQQLLATDELETYAYALLELHSRRTYALAEPPDVLPALIKEGKKSRQLLLTSARTFVVHGILSDSALADYKGPLSHRKLAMDLTAIARLLRQNWSLVGERTLLAAGRWMRQTS